MYASYHWAKISKKAYVLRMAVSIILISFFSAFFPVSIAIILTFPLTFLSFPFHAYIDPIWTEGWYWVDFLRIRFLTIDLTAPLPLDSGRFLVAFPFFLFVNFVGTTLGYWINEKLVEGSLIEKLFNFSFKSGAISFVGCYVISFSCFIILGLVTGYRLNHYLNDHTLSYAIANTILLFCIYYFWVPAVIATTIYGISKWFRRRRE
jgi:hypothetical protein